MHYWASANLSITTLAFQAQLGNKPGSMTHQVFAGRRPAKSLAGILAAGQVTFWRPTSGANTSGGEGGRRDLMARLRCSVDENGRRALMAYSLVNDQHAADLFCRRICFVNCRVSVVYFAEQSLTT